MTAEFPLIYSFEGGPSADGQTLLIRATGFACTHKPPWAKAFVVVAIRPSWLLRSSPRVVGAAEPEVSVTTSTAWC